jgi:hypothetical protein
LGGKKKKGGNVKQIFLFPTALFASMALVGDLVSILKEIKTKADTITIDAIWKELHSNEPLIEQLSGKEKQPQKRRSVKMVIPEEMKKLKRRSVGPVDSIGNIEKTKTVVFESAKDPNLFTFTKREVPPIQPRASPLSKLVGHVVFSEIKVFLPNEQKPVLVKIAQTAIFEKLIIMAVKKYNSQTPPPSTLLPEDPDAYMLRVADEKGNIDEDFPRTLTLVVLIMKKMCLSVHSHLFTHSLSLSLFSCFNETNGW